jgi:hypothetical protein
VRFPTGHVILAFAAGVAAYHFYLKYRQQKNGNG